MTTTAPETPKPRRRWLQFSLRTLMLLMLVLGVGLRVSLANVETISDKPLARTGLTDPIALRSVANRGAEATGGREAVAGWIGKPVWDILS